MGNVKESQVTRLTVTLFSLFMCASASAQTAWLDTNVRSIQYRFSVIGPSPGSLTCIMEFRNRDYPKGPSSVNVTVDFRRTSTTTQELYIPFDGNGVGRQRIENCAGVSDVYVK